MIRYRNTKVKVRSPDGDTEYFYIVAGVLQWDTLAPYLFIVCLDYVLRTSIDKIRENGFELRKERSRRYPAKTITDADYGGDSFTSKYTQRSWNTTAQFGTSRRRNLSETGWQSHLPRKSVSSTEKDIDTWRTKAWTAIDKLSVIWKSDLTDKMKLQFLPSSGSVDTAVLMHHLDAKKTARKEARRHLHKGVSEQY